MILFNYLMRTDVGNQYPATFHNPVSKGDKVVYKGTLYLVRVVIHNGNGTGSIIECEQL